MIEVFRPNISERKPENRAASHDPPAMEAVIPPSLQVSASALLVRGRKWSCKTGPWEKKPLLLAIATETCLVTDLTKKQERNCQKSTYERQT